MEPNSIEPLTFAIVTTSDTRSLDDDLAGQLIKDVVADRGGKVLSHVCVPDDVPEIKSAIIEATDELGADIVLTCGGTGFGPRDVTPEATYSAADRIAPGIAEAIRAESMKYTRRAMLSRGISVLRGRSLVVNLPGSKKAAGECLDVFIDQLEHAKSMLAGGGH